MIRSFADKVAHDIFHGIHSSTVRKQLPLPLVQIAERKLDLLNAVKDLTSIMELPDHRNDRFVRGGKEKYVIPINAQWCIAFRWNRDGIDEVEIKAA